jgi:hypothetical protein
MFTSEVCLYRSEEYFQGFITEGRSENGASALIKDRSLAAEGDSFFPLTYRKSVSLSNIMEVRTVMSGLRENAGIMVR